MEFARRNVANSAEMIHAIIYNFAASLSCNIRQTVLDNGAFSKPSFSSGELRRNRANVDTTNAKIRQEKLKTKDIQNEEGNGEGTGCIKGVLSEMCH